MSHEGTSCVRLELSIPEIPVNSRNHKISGSISGISYALRVTQEDEPLPSKIFACQEERNKFLTLRELDWLGGELRSSGLLRSE